MGKESRLPGFYKLQVDERLNKVAEWANLSEEEIASLSGEKPLSPELADKFIENVIGVFGMPLGVAANFLVDGRDVLIPMVVEEPSVVAGASFMARLARDGGGFITSVTEPEMIGQIQILDIPDIDEAINRIEENRTELLGIASSKDPLIIKLGGGPRSIETRVIDTKIGPMLIVHLIFDCRDAMGANMVNTACEALARPLEDITGGRVLLRILSNLADRRLVKAECRIPIDTLAFDKFSGDEVAKGIVEAWAFAEADPYRAATHNKGIMNGIDPVVIATGNDWRAVEAGAHAYAGQNGRYTSLTTWERTDDGFLKGEIQLPMAVGIVGGATRTHPAAKTALKILGISTASELASIIATLGLAQNLAALRALATEGIQKGHMALHARQIAVSAGASGDEIEKLVDIMFEASQIRSDFASRQLALLREIHSGEDR